LYQLTIGEQTYIGLTAAIGQAYLRSVKVRVQKHISRAKKESKDWAICEALRSDEVVQYEVIEVVRGRKAAHSREREYIKEWAPSLNTF
jgi:hypothetical protein